MKFASFCLFVLLHLAAATLDSRPKNAIDRVVNLIKELLNNVEEDRDREQKMYNYYVCWCETSTEAKADAIKKATEDIQTLSEEILTHKSRIQELKSQIKDVAQDLKTNERMIAEATKVREQQNVAFMGESGQIKSALVALEKAIDQMINKKASSMLQVQQAMASRAAVTTVLQQLPKDSPVTAEELALLTEFAGSTATSSNPKMKVISTMTNMFDTFLADLERATAAEADANRDFEEFLVVKSKEGKELKDALSRKKKDKSEADSAMADATSLYDQTREQKKADIEFFDATKSSCTSKSKEWPKRLALYAEEIDGIKKAVKILTTGEARETMYSATDSFLQLSSQTMEPSPAARAYAILKARSTKAHSLRLAQLAVKVGTAENGQFDKVVEQIDKMIVTLKDEGASDREKRDQCILLYQKSAMTVDELKFGIKSKSAKMDKIEAAIDINTEKMNEVTDAIKTAGARMQEVDDERKQESADFKKSKSDDEAAIKLLSDARNEISKFYEKNNVDVSDVSFRQQAKKKGEPMPDAEFSSADQNQGPAKAVLRLINLVIEDLQRDIKTADEQEKAAEDESKKMTEALQKLIKQQGSKKTALEEIIAAQRQESTELGGDIDNDKSEVKAEQDYKVKIKPDCDFIINEFSKRADRRAAESEALTDAKAMLLGARPNLLQQRRSKAYHYFG